MTMTGDVSSGNHNRSLKLTIRLSASSRFDVGSCGSITPSSTIRHVKEIISQREESGNCAVERQRLIHKGRILSEDSQTLADYGIGSGDGASNDGIVFYLVKAGGGGGNAIAGGRATATTNSSRPPVATESDHNASPNSNPFLNFRMFNNNNTNNPMASMMNMMGSGGMPDLAAFQQQLQQNPQMISDMLNNPMIQSMLNSPEFLTNMMENNPQMRAVMDSNPELRNALSDPEFMRRSMEMMRDPSAMQNMMRNQDLAMSQIENMPGGYSALRRMYEDVQEPMMDAMAGNGAGPRVGGSANRGGSDGGERRGSRVGSDSMAGASNAAMPNPWGADVPSPSFSAVNTNEGERRTAGAANPIASLMGSMGGTLGAAWTGGAAASNPWSNSTMGPNVPNLEATLQMMENPMMQHMMQNMMNNPETMRMMMDSNPMLRQMRQMNPQAAAIFDNPEMMRAMVDPNNLRAMLQMQQAMQQLSGGLPGLQGMMGMPPPPDNAAAPAAAGGLDFSTLLGRSGPGIPLGGAPASAPTGNPFLPFILPGGGQPASGTGGSTSQQPAPGQSFRQQLQNLQDMGFTDHSANIRALTSSNGNVNRAIEILLENPPEMGASSETLANGGDAAGNNAPNNTAGPGNDDGLGRGAEPKGSTEKKND